MRYHDRVRKLPIALALVVSGTALATPATTRLTLPSGKALSVEVMVKDEDLCVHCGLCAERCPTAAWDMVRSDLLIPYAGQESWATSAVAASTNSR